MNNGTWKGESRLMSFCMQLTKATQPIGKVSGKKTAKHRISHKFVKIV